MSDTPQESPLEEILKLLGRMENALNKQSIDSAKQEALEIIKRSPVALQQELQELEIYQNDDTPFAKQLADYVDVLNASARAGDVTTRTTDLGQRGAEVQEHLKEAKQEIYSRIEQEIGKSIQEQFKTIMGSSGQEPQ